MLISDVIAAEAMKAIKQKLQGAHVYYFAGPVPATPDEALDMQTLHTQCVKFSVDDNGSALSFEDPTGPVLSKALAEKWEGTIAYEGAHSTSTTLTPTFFRICPAGDNGRGASNDGRIQGTIGGPNAATDIRMSDGTTVTAGNGNKRSLPLFNIRMVAI